MNAPTPTAPLAPVSPPAPDVARVVSFFETLTPSSVAHMGAVYHPTARFVDPFNDVQGLAAIEGIFKHMFVALEEPRFVVTGQVVQGNQCFLVWDFHFRFTRFRQDTLQTIRGTTHLVFADSGLVTLHRDYWDAAQELYEKLPLVGSLMRWLKKRANA